MATRTGLRAALLLGMLAACPAHAAGMFLLPNGTSVFNTGLSAGTDPNYLMSINPFNPGSTAAFLQGAVYLSANDANSGWLTPAGTGTHAPEAIYQIDTVIDLTGIDPATIAFHGFWVSDNAGLDILVNGSSTGQTNSGAHGALPSAFAANAFTLTGADGLVAGANTISFNWGNGPAGGAASQFPNPVHVRVEFTGFTITPIPLPGAAWPFAAMLAWLLRRRIAAPA